MAKVLANGQITIVDLNDGKAVQCFTQASLGDTQIYTPDTNTYTPNFLEHKQQYGQVIAQTGNRYGVWNHILLHRALLQGT